MKNIELDLHSLTVDEALLKLDVFLHDAYRGGLYHIWIVHGKGTGILRREVARYLSGHPLVARFYAADRWHGGVGATEVELISR